MEVLFSLLLRFMKKNLFLIALSLSLFLFTNCTTTENLLTFPNPQGNTIFLRPVSIADKKQDIQQLNIDITVLVSEDQILENPVLNFTITSKNLDKLQNCTLQLKSPSKTIECEKLSRLYKQIGSQKNTYDFRYTSEINKEDFLIFLKDLSSVTIILKQSDGTEYFYYSKEFENKLSELRLLLI